LQSAYPWTQGPLIVCAPMRVIVTAPLAVAVSEAGGLGFLGAGNDTRPEYLEELLSESASLIRRSGVITSESALPVGIGFLNWGASLQEALPAIEKYRPCAVWLFAPRQASDLETWSSSIRALNGSATKIWVQVGGVDEAIDACRYARPDVLVVQGSDAGGHGLQHGAGIISLLPEVSDGVVKAYARGGPLDGLGSKPALLAAGGVADGRGVAASLALGAEGVVLGTRYLASHEVKIAKGYRDEVLRARDGGRRTVRSKVYDTLRGTTEWPAEYGGRGVINLSYEDATAGLAEEENKRLYQQAMKAGDQGWGPGGRMTTYAGTAVGLVREVQSANDITRSVREECNSILRRMPQHS